MNTNLFQRIEQAYPGAVHQLGNKEDNWAKKAKLDWKISESPMAYTTDGKKISLFEGRRVLFRDDTGEPLATVGSKFKPFQPADMLLFHKELADKYGFKLALAGEINRGRKIWCMAEVPFSFELSKGDNIGAHLFVISACDGSMSTKGFFTSIRLWCLNQLPVLDLHAKKGKSYQIFSCGHGQKFSSARVDSDLKRMEDNWKEFKVAAEVLANKKVSEEAAMKFLSRYFDVPKELEVNFSISGIESLRDNHTFKKLLSTYRVGEGQENVVGTAWGVVNAVTRFMDHGLKTKDESFKIKKGWVDGSLLKDRIFREALTEFTPKYKPS